ncbi:MAG: hypothetical protein JWN48_4119 [Myxococcaceae bacterium]|nr:hypothetical protein [Myxococcaceae bacterium]
MRRAGPRNQAPRHADNAYVHSTPQARLCLVCLVCLLGTLVLARLAEARFGAQPPASASPRRWARGVAQSTGEGDALRDGQALDPNFASAAELEILPGVGPRLAREIVAMRARAGPFRALRELRKVRGIGDKTLAKLTPYLRIDSKRLEHAAQSK